MEGVAVNRLAAQQRLLLEIWEALPPGHVLGVEMLLEILNNGEWRVTRGALTTALRYLEASGLLRCGLAGRWRRVEGK